MAAGNKKGQTKKKTDTKKNTSNKTESSKDNKVLTEVMVLTLMAICIIVFLTNFGVGGIVGKAISSFFFGLLGIMEYIFPILVFIAVIFSISNKNNSVARVKLIFSVLELIFVCSLIQLISGSHAKEWSVADYYIHSKATKTGGGFLGGMLCKLFCTWFGTAGAYIFTIVLIIISLVIITEKSFIGGVKKGSRKVYDTAKKDVKEYRADVDVKRRERERKRELKESEAYRREKKSAKGVTFNTLIEDNNAKESVYNFEKASDFPKEKQNISDEEYDDICKASEYEMRHYQDEQSSPFEPAYEEYEVAATANEHAKPEAEQKTEQKTENVSNEEENPIDMELIRNELEKEHLTKESAAVADSEIKKEKNASNKPARKYKFPPLSLLKHANAGVGGTGGMEHKEVAGKLQEVLRTFGVNARVVSVSVGPTVTRYELEPEMGTKVSKIVSLADDIKLNLAAADIRIEAPIPGKSLVGIEVPNKSSSAVMLGDLISSKNFKNHKSKICFAAGKDIGGEIVIADIAKMPHLLIAGQTGSGKSVCVNTIIMSILYHASPEEVKLIMVDPKVVELNVYNGIPHLLTPVVTDPKKATAALNWAVAEMMKRYKLFADAGVRNLEGYNEKISDTDEEKMAQIVIIVDEFADLMMVASKEVEDAIVRLAQLARAAGIHLILATQRPTVNVITGLIKANVPSRIAFSVASATDSRTILDTGGADKLLGKGDMLFFPNGYPKPVRVQGAFVSDEEVAEVVQFLKDNNQCEAYSEEVHEHISNPGFEESQAFGGEEDQYFAEAGKFIIEKERASIGMLQRVFKIGFNRAARIMDQLGEAGVVGPEEGTKPRKVLMTMEEFEQYLANR